MKNYTNVALVITIFLSFNLSAETQPKKPKLIIKAIKNDTLFTLLLMDRINTNKSITINPGQTIESNLKIKGSKNVVINGNMKEIMAAKAQFIIKKLDAEGKILAEKESYLNICTVPGGVNDGSGFITGTPGSVIFKFLMASKTGGCIMSARKLKNDNCALAEINLELSTQESDIKNDVFRVYGRCEVSEK